MSAPARKAVPLCVCVIVEVANTGCRSDRFAWVAALSQAKQQLANGQFTYADISDHSRRRITESNTVLADDITSQIRNLGAPPPACALVESTLSKMIETHKEELHKARLELAQYKQQLNELADDKRVLETKFVTDQSALQSAHMPDGSEVPYARHMP